MLQTLNVANFTGGGTIGWNVSNAVSWNGSDNMVFEFGAFWLDPSMRVDLTNGANRGKFNSLTGGNLDTLTRSEGIAGSIPRHFHVGNADQWNDGGGINRATGNWFLVTAGLVSQITCNLWI